MSMCCIDYDPPEFFIQIYRKARKEHKCCEYRATINKGDEYQYTSGKWEGKIDSFKTCEKCADLRDSLEKVYCPAYYDLRDSYKEYLNEIGMHQYNEEKDEYFYPENHMKLNT